VKIICEDMALAIGSHACKDYRQSITGRRNSSELIDDGGRVGCQKSRSWIILILLLMLPLMILYFISPMNNGCKPPLIYMK
jgi:hypothetical protein